MQDTVTAPADTFAVLSPMQGWLWPLEATPDPAFADGAIGPGVALDPLEGLVTSPIDGTIVTFNASHHAVVIRHASGVEILIHVGIDTVALGGRGFTAHVSLGDVVAAGDPLLTCDLDAVADAGKSLVSPVVVISPAGARIVWFAPSGAVERGAELFSVTIAPVAIAAANGGATLHRHVTVGLPHGIHARPAAALSRLVREGGMSGTLSAGDRHADLTSVVALMRAGIARGEGVEVALAGDGAETVLDQVCALLSGDFAEALPVAPTPPASRAASAPGLLAGLAGSPGLAVGPSFRHRPPQYVLSENGQGVEAERARLAQALRDVEAELSTTAASTAAGQVFGAHRELLADPELRALAERDIAAGHSAGHAWQEAAREIAASFAAGEGWLVERQADLFDLSGRVLARLADAPPVLALPPAGAIMLADDLLPSELAHYARSGVAGVALAGSSPTAHVAIIAAGMALPLVTGLGPQLKDIPEDRELVLDANAGTLAFSPDPATLAAARQAIADLAAASAADRAAAQAGAMTRDGFAIAVQANLGGAEDALTAVQQGADGSGLLRTEFLFLNRDAPPDEEEQFEAYRAVILNLGGRPLTIRTLDVGGDKPVRFLPFPKEENPALGLRGIRVGLAQPELLATQLRAVLRASASPGALVELMVPMIADLGEWRAVREAVSAAQTALGLAPSVKLGMMIETPAAVLLADQLAANADFLSIGTNDLTQYVLAMDRTNRALAASADPMHPAVLRAIAWVCEAAAAHSCPVSVCGGLAADPLAIPLLVGLGVEKLSVVPAAVPATKRTVRTTDRAQWAGLAPKALALTSAAEVRDFCRERISRQEQGQ